MKFYICARYGRREEARELADRLIQLGHQITSTWLWQVEDEMLYDNGPLVAGQFAQKDVDEVESGNGIVYLSEPTDNVWGRGGRHVEFGVAIAFKKDLYVVGPLENLFHYLPKVVQCDSADDFINFVVENYDEETTDLGEAVI